MKRILIIRLSAIGDVVMASGLIPALRMRWPQAHLAWLTEPGTAGLLSANPRLDQIIVWPRQEWRNLLRARRYGCLLSALLAFVRTLRGQRFDLVLDTQGLLKSAIWARASGARRRIGINSREGSRWLLTDTITAAPDDPGIGSEYRELATFLGAPAGAFALDLVLAGAEHAAAAGHLEAAGVEPSYAVLCPFTTRPQKHWFEERWRELAQMLSGDLGLTPVLLGGPHDREAAARIAAGGVAVDMAGRLPLAQSAALIAGARLLIGVDTGLTHMGVAAGVPTVALFGSTRPYRETGRANVRILYHELACAPCRRHPSCDEAYDCMRLHTPATVLVAAAEAIST